MARELRGDALNGLHCPDADTLAAYHERLLPPVEMVAQKSHIASCARCQEILATLEVTESVSNEALQPVHASAATAQNAQRPAAAATALSRHAEVTATTSKVREMPKPKSYLRWAVPAGAIAAGLLVWVAINGSWNQRKAEMSKTATAPVEVAAPAAKPEGAFKADSDLKEAPAQEADKELRDRLEKSGGLPARRAQNLPHGPAVLQNQTQNQIQNNASSNEFSYRQNQTASGAGASAGASVSGDLSAYVPPGAAGNTRKKTEEAAKAAPAPPPAAKAPASADAGARKDIGSMSETVEVTTAAPLVDPEPATKPVS